MLMIEFVKLVEGMRNSQKDYFRTRSKSALESSKRLEERVDKALVEMFSGQTKLFEMD